MQGYKTWIGLILTMLGVFGVFEKIGISKDQINQILDGAVQLVGLIVTAYGNYDAHKRLQKLQ